MSKAKNDETLLMTKKDTTKIEFDFIDKTITYWSVGDSYLGENKYTKINININEIYKDVINLGKFINEIGNTKNELYTKAYNKSLGKDYTINLVEKNFITEIIEKIKNVNINIEKLSEESSSTNQLNNIKDKVLFLNKKYGIEMYTSHYERDLIELLSKIHILYEFNEILTSIDNNKECHSKIWSFTDKNNKPISNNDILELTKYYFSKLFEIKVKINYDNKKNRPVYYFDNIIDIVAFKMFSLFTTCGLKLNKKPKTRVCSICGVLYLPTSNIQKYCESCIKIGQKNRQRKHRAKLKT